MDLEIIFIGVIIYIKLVFIGIIYNIIVTDHKII